MHTKYSDTYVRSLRVGSGSRLLLSRTVRGGRFRFDTTSAEDTVASQSPVVFCVTLPKYVHDMESVSVSTLRSYDGDHVAPRIMYVTCMERTHARTHTRVGRTSHSPAHTTIPSTRNGRGTACTRVNEVGLGLPSPRR